MCGAPAAASLRTRACWDHFTAQGHSGALRLVLRTHPRSGGSVEMRPRATAARFLLPLTQTTDLLERALRLADAENSGSKLDPQSQKGYTEPDAVKSVSAYSVVKPAASAPAFGNCDHAVNVGNIVFGLAPTGFGDGQSGCRRDRSLDGAVLEIDAHD